MVQRSHPHVVAALVTELEGSPTSPSLQAASQCRAELTGKMGFVPLSRDALGERPPFEPEDQEPGTSQRGLQHEACMHVESEFRAELFTRDSHGPRDEHPIFSSALCCSDVFAMLSPFLCSVADVAVHHRATCAQAGMLGRRGYALESIMARICREACGRVRTNLMVCDMDVPAPVAVDNRRLEVVVDGLPVRGRWRWTPRWSALCTEMVCDVELRRETLWHSNWHARR